MGREGNSSPAKGYSYFVVYVTENVLGESYELPVESIFYYIGFTRDGLLPVN